MFYPRTLSSSLVFPAAAIAFSVLLALPSPGECEPVVPIDPERLQLFYDALSWMTFSEGDEIILEFESQYFERENRVFFKWLLEKYSYSKFYRSFVIAFQKGVLPKLTLQENQACDPSYVWQYKNRITNQVTWHGQKKFTFYSYAKRNDPSVQYCDYRQGLVCNPSTSRCECPPGTSMEYPANNALGKRCLLLEGKACALPNLDQGVGAIWYLKDNLVRMVFNMEKPPGCNADCRCGYLNQPDSDIPRCHNRAKTNWWPFKDSGDTPVLSIGAPCSLSFAAHQGHCSQASGNSQFNPAIGNAPGYTCYNFGPPRSLPKTGLQENLEGFCAHELGSLQIKKLWAFGQYDHLRLWTHNFIMGFVHPRSVPLDKTQLRDYYLRYLNNVHDNVFPVYTGNFVFQSVKPGEPCSVAKTKKMDAIWKYYAGLEADPPPGKDFVLSATKQMLDDKLKEMEDLVNGNATVNNGKFCKVYWSFNRDKYTDSPSPSPALECVAGGASSGDNDGTCQVSTDTSTKAFAEKVQELSDYAWKAAVEETNEEKNADQTILNDNPEPAPCTPLKNDKACPEGYFCYYYYADGSNIYNSQCELKTPVSKLTRTACHSFQDGGSQLGTCEGKLLDKLIQEELDNPLEKLERGDNCSPEFEDEIRKGARAGGTWKGNKYETLVTLKQPRKRVPKLVFAIDGGYCDRSKLLTCDKTKKICKCLGSTRPREVTLEDGNVYRSDYCYYPEGECDKLEAFMARSKSTTEAQKDRIFEHYGKPGKECKNGNVCVFVDLEKNMCTGNNTGKTGLDLGTPSKGNKKKPGPVVLPPPKHFSDGSHMVGEDKQHVLSPSLIFTSSFPHCSYCTFSVLLTLPSPGECGPVVPMDPERLQLLFDSLSWMTFRRGNDVVWNFEIKTHQRMQRTNYLPSGFWKSTRTPMLQCDQLEKYVDQSTSTTQAQKDRIYEHYGKPGKACENGNVCVFLDLEKKECTGENTGKTGVDVKEKATTKRTTTTTKPGKGYTSRKPGVPGKLPPPKKYSGGGGKVEFWGKYWTGLGLLSSVVGGKTIVKSKSGFLGRLATKF